MAVQFIEPRVGTSAACATCRKGCTRACWKRTCTRRGRDAGRGEREPLGGATSPCTTSWTVGRPLAASTRPGDVVIVRFADDFMVGFEHRDDAVRFLSALRERMGSSIWSCIRKDAADRVRALCGGPRSGGLRETGDLQLARLHARCSTTRNGKYTVRRQTMRSGFARSCKQSKTAATAPAPAHPAAGRLAQSVLRGHYPYFAVPRHGCLLTMPRHLQAVLGVALRRRVSATG